MTSNRSSLRTRRIAGATAAALGTLAVSSLIVAPAHAIGQIDVSPGFAGRYGAGCTYTLTVPAKPGSYVYFTDNGMTIGGGAQPVSGGVATLKWKPASTGAHLLRALEAPSGAVSVAKNVAVGQGLDLGSSCLAF
ncbi:hypothetical protein [Gordonia terrae]|uniref:hypothetical protein n=1 Tax=Gordonia terrae TaxID=2055 RepID=UPI003F6CF58C